MSNINSLSESTSLSADGKAFGVIAENKRAVKELGSTSDYLLQASLNQLHVESIEWESEIKMLLIDADFFDKMLAKSALMVASDEVYYEIHDKKKGITQFLKKLEILSERIKLHEHTLANIIDKEAPHGEQQYRKTHIELNNELYIFLKNYKQLKETIYSILRPILLEKH